MNPGDQEVPVRLSEAVMNRLNAHDLLGVMAHGAPADEYRPEAEDFARLIAQGAVISPEVVAGVWHKWFGDSSEEAGPPTSGMASLAADLQTVGHVPGR